MLLLFLFTLQAAFAVAQEGQTEDSTSPAKHGEVPSQYLLVISEKFFKDPYSRAAYDPAISLLVQNLSQERITAAIIRLTVTCDGGKRRLFEDRFIHYPDRVVNPGEIVRWELFPRNDGKWGMTDFPYDAQLKVSFDKVYCPKKNAPYQHEFQFSTPQRRDYAY